MPVGAGGAAVGPPPALRSSLGDMGRAGGARGRGIGGEAYAGRTVVLESFKKLFLSVSVLKY